MYQTINFDGFRRAFERVDRGYQFSYAGLSALFDYLEESEQGGAGHELDVIALCCEWAEYLSPMAAAIETGWCGAEDVEDEEAEEAALAWLQDETTVIEFDSGILVANF